MIGFTMVSQLLASCATVIKDSTAANLWAISYTNINGLNAPSFSIGDLMINHPSIAHQNVAILHGQNEDYDDPSRAPIVNAGANFANSRGEAFGDSGDKTYKSVNVKFLPVPIAGPDTALVSFVYNNRIPYFGFGKVTANMANPNVTNTAILINQLEKDPNVTIAK